MTAQQQEELPGTPSDTPDNSQPQLIEGPGRYAVYEAPDGDWVLARATGLCETCRGCGCGEQAEPVPLPNFTRGRQYLAGWAMKNLSSLRALMGGD